MSDNIVFVDTNILVYAYDKSEKEKRKKCKSIVEKCFKGEKTRAISNQVLSEFMNVVTRKISRPLPLPKTKEIVRQINGIDSWKKFSYTAETVQKTAEKLTEENHFWDQLIAETMKENNCNKIYTENTEDFKEISGITVKNPLESV